MTHIVSTKWEDLGDFSGLMYLDNVEAVTLKPNPTKYESIEQLNQILVEYLTKRSFDYCLYIEKAGAYHYHGIIAFPSYNMWQNFRRWFNKNYGYIHISPKNNENLCGWYNYCIKTDKPQKNTSEKINNKIYMFD